MRIGFFTAIEGWGGSEIYLKTLMLSLRQLGHDPVLIGVEGSRLFKDLQAERVECVAWKTDQKKAPRLQVIDSRPALKYSERRGSGLKGVVLGMLPGWVKLLAGNIREVCDLRLILKRLELDVLQVTVHGYEVAGVAARLGGIPVVAVYQISPAREPYWVRRLLIRWTARSYHRVCFVSNYSAAEWRKITGLNPGRCEVVPNGADLRLYEEYRPAFVRDPKKTFQLVSVGRLHPMKGYRFLLEAMAFLNDPAIELDILGEGDEEVELRKMAHNLGIESTVNFRGHVENPENYLKKADCFVLVSVSHEGSPFVLAEAMAAGLPLVTSDYGPLPEINIHNETGLVVPMCDSKGLAGAIRLLQGQPEVACRMGAAGRKRSALYDQHQMVAKMLAQYERVLKNYKVNN